MKKQLNEMKKTYGSKILILGLSVIHNFEQ